MTPVQFRQDLRKAVRTISAITGKTVQWFSCAGMVDSRRFTMGSRYSSRGRIHLRFEHDAAADYRQSAVPVDSSSQALAAGHIWELPPLVARTRLGNLPIGGGWGLRVFPYRLINKAIRKLNAQGHPAVIFLHPREFDHNNPQVSLPLAKRFVLEACIEPRLNGLRACSMISSLHRWPIF